MKGADFSAFTAFLAVAVNRSFRAAAIQLNMTPSAISHSIKVLEKRLNVRLFSPDHAQRLSDRGGRALVAKLRPAMEAIGDALQELDTHDQTPTGTVRINASEGAIRLVLKPILAGFLARYPGIHLDIVSDGRLSDIVGDGFDAASVWPRRCQRIWWRFRLWGRSVSPLSPRPIISNAALAPPFRRIFITRLHTLSL
ncbi:D-malate degradation protein R [Raoultella terrigena]|uniref:D-malate degradation protein R n=1 Tax=Raoultella terrigena TaxID=577 RepID=A0A4U9D2W1_RAOTE|nr:D-malate degradation protein R [Raoultella terrigena]